MYLYVLSSEGGGWEIIDREEGHKSVSINKEHRGKFTMVRKYSFMPLYKRKVEKYIYDDVIGHETKKKRIISNR